MKIKQILESTYDIFGIWITETGRVIKFTREEHWEIVSREMHLDWDRYTMFEMLEKAFKHGWIRVVVDLPDAIYVQFKKPSRSAVISLIKEVLDKYPAKQFVIDDALTIKDSSYHTDDVRQFARYVSSKVSKSIKERLDEMPIQNITKIGNWDKNSSFRTQDRAIINNPKGIEKIKAKWSKTSAPFNIYLVNNPEGKQYREWGMVSMKWLQDHLPKTMQEIKEPFDPNAINILYVDNAGDQRVPFTAWIMAHRFGHAVARYSLQGSYTRPISSFTDARNVLYQYTSDILQSYGITDFPDQERGTLLYRPNIEKNRQNDLLAKNFFQYIGTFKSAREKKIRNEFEFTMELLAQYMTTGKITFNPLPKSFTVSMGGFRKRTYRFKGEENEYRYCNNTLQDMAETLENTFESLLQECVGKVFVM